MKNEINQLKRDIDRFHGYHKVFFGLFKIKNYEWDNKIWEKADYELKINELKRLEKESKK